MDREIQTDALSKHSPAPSPVPYPIVLFLISGLPNSSKPVRRENGKRTTTHLRQNKCTAFNVFTRKQAISQHYRWIPSSIGFLFTGKIKTWFLPVVSKQLMCSAQWSIHLWQSLWAVSSDGLFCILLFLDRWQQSSRKYVETERVYVR